VKSKKLPLEKIRKLSWGEYFRLWKQTVIEFASENSLFHGAALSYYTVFALVPIIYLSIVSFGKIIGQKTMVKIISGVLKDQVGIKDVQGIIDFLNQIDFEKSNVLLQTVGIFVLLISATAMLASLKRSINEFYDIVRVIKDKKKKILANLLDKLLHVGLLMFFGLVIVLVYFSETFMISFGDRLFSGVEFVHHFATFCIQNLAPLLTNFIIFYFIFRFLHDAIVPRKIAMGGALVTTVLLYLGQLLIKYYLLHYFFAKDAGIAGTLLILLTWVYYTSQIIFFGAKFTMLYANMVGCPLQVKA
jgi:membrane protein